MPHVMARVKFAEGGGMQISSGNLELFRDGGCRSRRGFKLRTFRRQMIEYRNMKGSTDESR